METKRLRLLPFTRLMMATLLEDRAAFIRQVGALVPDSWPGPDFTEALPFFITTASDDPAASLWSRIILHKNDRVFIGVTGFAAPPDAGGVAEFGYSVIPEYRRQGYATEAVLALCDWAREQPSVKKLIATCMADNLASIRILEKVGLSRAHESGEIIEWEYRG